MFLNNRLYFYVWDKDWDYTINYFNKPKKRDGNPNPESAVFYINYQESGILVQKNLESKSAEFFGGLSSLIEIIIDFLLLHHC